MENTDNTLREMHQQMQQLQEMLANERIVNDRLLRKSCRMTVNRLKLKSSVPVIAGFAGLALIPFLKHLGFSNIFLSVTGVLMLIAIAAALLTKRHIPSVEGDLVTAARDISRFRKINADWIAYGIPALAVWLGVLIWDMVKNLHFGREDLFIFIGGISVGLIIGLTLGLKNRRDILSASDELIAQIGELKG